MSDNEIKRAVTNLKKADGKSFEFLYKTYAPRLFNFSKKYLQNIEDCEEIVQITFEAIWTNKEKLDENRPFSNYVFSIAKNWIVNFVRKDVYKKAFIDHVSKRKTEFSFVVDDRVAFNDLSKILEKVINKLPKQRKLIYNLRRKNGYSYKEIASKLSISESTVNSQMTKAIAFIKKQIDETY